MVDRLINLCKLVTIIKERGNFPLIRRSRRQLRDFLLCRGTMNRRCLFLVLPYWFHLLKGLDVLIWRLETFGFLYLPGQSEEDKQRLNSRL
jgi:hypothetical protein